MASTGVSTEVPAGVSRAYLIGHPETRTTTAAAVTGTLSGLAWATIIVLVMLTSTRVLSSDAAMIEVVCALVGAAVLLGFAAIAAIAVRVTESRMSSHHQAIYEGVEDFGTRASNYEQAVCDILGSGRLTAIPRQR